MSVHSVILVVASTMVNELFCNVMLGSFTGVSEKRVAFMITEDETTFRRTPSKVLFFFRICLPDQIF